MLGKGIGQEIYEFSDAKLMEFYIIVLFAELAGLNGETLEGSMYMTERKFRQFSICASALRQLVKGEDENAVYNRVLSANAEAMGLSLDERSVESKAIWRLTCMAKVEDGA